MPGKVFVFNLTNDTIHNLNLNGRQTESIAAPVNRAPQKIAVDRVLNASDGSGRFFNGHNNIFISFSSGMNGMMTFRIDGNQLPLNQDICLYIAKNRAFAVNEYGVVTDTMEIQIGGFQSTGDGFVPNEVHTDANAPVN